MHWFSNRVNIHGMLGGMFISHFPKFQLRARRNGREEAAEENGLSQ